MKFLLLNGGLSKSNLTLKFICFGANGVMMLQGSKIRVTMQLKEKHVPFLLVVHSAMHQPNLTV